LNIAVFAKIFHAENCKSSFLMTVLAVLKAIMLRTCGCVRLLELKSG
jgi:hypothetical protein